MQGVRGLEGTAGPPGPPGPRVSTWAMQISLGSLPQQELEVSVVQLPYKGVRAKTKSLNITAGKKIINKSISSVVFFPLRIFFFPLKAPKDTETS